jgi:hypothetical protein
MYYIGLDVHKNLKKVKKVRKFRRCPRDPLLSMPDNSVSRQFGVPNFVLTTKALLIIETMSVILGPLAATQFPFE